MPTVPNSHSHHHAVPTGHCPAVVERTTTSTIVPITNAIERLTSLYLPTARRAILRAARHLSAVAVALSCAVSDIPPGCALCARRCTRHTALQAGLPKSLLPQSFPTCRLRQGMLCPLLQVCVLFRLCLLNDPAVLARYVHSPLLIRWAVWVFET